MFQLLNKLRICISEFMYKSGILFTCFLFIGRIDIVSANVYKKTETK